MYTEFVKISEHYYYYIKNGLKTRYTIMYRLGRMRKAICNKVIEVVLYIYKNSVYSSVSKSVIL